MSRSASAVLGVLALAASASASHSLRRTSSHARVAAARRSDAVSGVAYYGYQNNTMNACGTISADSDMIIGIGPDFYGDIDTVSSKCFQHITVALASDPTTNVDVTLTDACDECGGDGNIYLSIAAFKALSGGSLEAGVLHVDWAFSSDTFANSGSTPSSTGSDDGDDEDCEDDQDGTDEQDGTATTAATSKAAAAPATSKGTAATATSKAAAAPSKAAPQPAAKTSTAKTSTPTKTSSSPSSDGWKITHALEGSAFLDFFNYDSGTGDNNGVANYVNGISTNLARTDGDQVVLAVDTTQNVETRKSLRLVSKTTYNAEDNNLFIFDIARMPAVCGTWPAVWFTGANWPYDGEIDVVEGVSLYEQNIYSVHTGDGCSIPKSAMSSMNLVTPVEATVTNCNANADPAACGFTDESKSTFGPSFNSAGGGVFALVFDTDVIQTYFFQANEVPADITSQSPTPSKWGAPRMSISSSTCDTSTNFKDLMMVVDTNLAGTFTEGVWGVAGAGGQVESCQKTTGVDTAAEYVQGHGSAFGDDAQWKINGFYIYSK